jgi:MFS family permease
VVVFTGLACLAVFFHPGLAPLIARQVLGPSPQALGVFTSVLAAGSIIGGLLLQRNSTWLSRRPSLLLGGCTLLTSLAQLGMASGAGGGVPLVMTFLIGAGTAGLLAGSSLITQVSAPLVLRGRMAGLSQIAFLGGGGLSGLLAAWLRQRAGLPATFAVMGSVGLVLSVVELLNARWPCKALRAPAADAQISLTPRNSVERRNAAARPATPRNR